MPRKEGSRSAGKSPYSTNTFIADQSYQFYNQSAALATLTIAENNNHLFYSDWEALLGQLAEEFVHQVGNPLCALKGFIALGAQNDSNFGPWAELIEQEIEQIEKTLKTFSLLAGHPYEKAETMDLRLLIADIITRFTPLAIAKGVWLTLPYPAHPLRVQVSHERLGVALIQLLNNALEASNPGGVIDISLHNTVNQARISITNTTSEPLPGSLLSRPQPFLSTKPDHSGLGLWLANRIAGSYGGQVKIENRDTVVTATISLPLIR
ncbi:MAG: sensor histidine kinase [Methylocystaceae bacterium]